MSPYPSEVNLEALREPHPDLPTFDGRPARKGAATVPGILD